MKTVIQSRKFWAAIATMLMITLTAFLPGFPNLETTLTDLGVLMAAYILGTAVDHPPVPVQDGLRTLLHSRKFWAAFAGLVVILFRSFIPDFPLDDAQLTVLISTVAAYIFGTGLQDRLAHGG